MEQEHRIYNFSNLEVRASENGNSVIEGYASVFNKDSLDLGGFVETVNPNAFSRTLVENPDIRALWNHDSGEPLARTVSKTLEVSADENGLKVRINLPSTGKGPFVAEMVKRGDIKEMSFGFITRKDKWDINSVPNRRELLDVDLYEVSPVTFPAYPDTSLAMRSLNEAKKEAEANKPQAEQLSDETIQDEFETLSRRVRLAKI